MKIIIPLSIFVVIWLLYSFLMKNGELEIILYLYKILKFISKEILDSIEFDIIDKIIMQSIHISIT